MTDQAPRRIVVVGASAGGVEALSRLASDLPRKLRAPVFVVLHVSPIGTSSLPKILARSGPLPAVHPRDGDPIEPGHIYVAPPDRHMLVRDGTIEVVRGPRENLARPAIDPLFRSAAASHGPNVIAAVLSGTQADGAGGAAAVSRAGGVVLVQDPEEAVFPEMPLNTIAQDHPDGVLPLDRIAERIVQLVGSTDGLSEEVKMRDDSRDEMSLEASYSALEIDAVGRDKAPGELTPFSCPECGGALWEMRDGQLPRYRCRVGHAYALESVVDDQSDAVDRALWVALRALLERASLSERIAERIRNGNGSDTTAKRFDRLSEEAHAEAAVIREVLLRRDASAA
jgi:two-component system, chemotaxis family, protein-glutamate methylesterase/glutaminase